MARGNIAHTREVPLWVGSGSFMAAPASTANKQILIATRQHAARRTNVGRWRNYDMRWLCSNVTIES